MSCNVIVRNRVDDNNSGADQGGGGSWGSEPPDFIKRGKNVPRAQLQHVLEHSFPKPPFPKSSICPYKVEDDNTFTYARS